MRTVPNNPGVHCRDKIIFLDQMHRISIQYSMTGLPCLSTARCMTGFAVIIFLAALLCGTPLHAQELFPVSAAQDNPDRALVNGEIIAAEISRATGLAISPILGLSVLGAYTYYTTPAAERTDMPWHARPAFWGPLLTVLLGIFLKDSAKIALPKILLMPLDAVETLLEKNVSAILALLVILSSITGRGIDQLHFPGLTPDLFLQPAYAAGYPGTAASSGLPEIGVLSLVLIIVFAVVWVVGQSFNFLILLSPFSWLDLLLTGFKNSILALLLGAYLINPFLGLGTALVFIVFSFFLFARSYRFVIFGTLFAADILFKKSRREPPDNGRIQAFTGSAVAGAPSMSYGCLAAEKETLVFHYRPWLILPSRTVETSFVPSQCEVGKGMVSPVILAARENRKSYRTLFRLRPLYHCHENKVAETLGLKGIRDVTFGRSLREGLAWLREQTGLQTKEKNEAA
ncbi:MAG: hypothetical protein SCH71_12405 [Desulfobulbaceae bacterium]|nr:hypothetical protein [Desulfobulbaceae bacterium]